ncbi:MAG: hypothetical protein QM802_23550 [Agriterribacter sp.]
MKKSIYKNLRKSVAWLTHAGIKTTSLLLITTAFSMMSFTDDGTNINAPKRTKAIQQINRQKTSTFISDICCADKPDKYNNQKKELLISIPGKQLMLKADRENAAAFLSEIKATDLQNIASIKSAANADAEMEFNFQISNIFPSAESAIDADTAMVKYFIEDVVSKMHQFNSNTSMNADEEMINQFMKENFSLSLEYSMLRFKADIEMIIAFEEQMN